LKIEIKGRKEKDAPLTASPLAGCNPEDVPERGDDPKPEKAASELFLPNRMILSRNRLRVGAKNLCVS
jgi:hypothetical protein